MKNIIVLTILVIMNCIVFANNFAYCEESPAKPERKYGFSVGNQFGFVHGYALEIVYPEPNTTMGKLLSELKWDMKSVFYYGVYMDFQRKDLSSGSGFFSSVSFKAGVPGDSGRLENRDWISRESDALTHFSRHTNKTRELYWLDIKAGITIPIESYFYVKLFISGSWMRFAFTARDGWGQYPWGHQVFAGDVITYEQNWFVLAEGLSIGTRYFYPFALEASFQISPLIYCLAVDEHFLRNYTFVDILKWGVFLEPSVRAFFTIQHIELSLNFAYRHIGGLRGEAYIRRGDSDFFFSAGESGAGLSLIDASFLFKLRL